MSGQSSRAVELFGIHTFNTNAMRQKLPRKAFKEVQDILHRKTNKKLTKELASQIAHGMKAWAIENGATHFSHWFQPLTGSTAEKHDGFLELDSGSVGERQAIDHFSYAELLQSEPDASSFPHGGMRTTFEARGYTAWDPTSPAFLLVEGSSRTLCIPSLFVSYHGMVLDKKTPLLRSLEVLDRSTKALLKLLGKEVDEPIQTYLGLEQEFFLVDRKLGLQRKDLVIGGRTMFGAPAPKEQQLGDHYFGRMPPQVLEFMETLQEEAYKLGIPIKTRHNEAAPRQYEVAPIFESSNLAIDHNLLLMSIMKRAAKQNDMMLLLHEKPFSGVNGSGKHNNWSLGTPSLGNFLEPGETPESNLQFLLFLICVIRAVYNRADLLRMSIACHGNDFRLGGHEAPPAIMSVFLGDELHAILEAIKGDESLSANSQQFLSLGVSKLDAIQRHNTDRNRTSPFAFTGNKFEFRAVPSSISCAFPNTVLNLAMAEAIDQITLDLDAEIKAAGGDRDKALFKILRTEIIRTERIRFEGDGYSHEWVEEAERRGLKNIANTFDALASLPDNSDLFVKYGVLSDGEVQAFYNICAEQFIVGAEIEARTLIQMLEVDLIPAVLQHQKSLCDNLVSLTTFFKSLGLEAGEEQDFVTQRKAALDFVHQTSSLIRETQTLKSLLEKEESLANLPDRGSFCVRSVQAQMLVIRGLLDSLEQITPSSLWPFPTYTDLLDPGTA